MWYITRRYIRLLALGWGPVVLLMALLFVSSAQPRYGPPEGLAAQEIYLSGAMPIFPGLLDVLIKKGAHLIVYGLLGLLALRALTQWGVALPRAFYLAILVATCYAFLDELHQAFVPGRHASGLDIALDYVGIALFTLLAWRRLLGAAAAPLHPPQVAPPPQLPSSPGP